MKKYFFIGIVAILAFAVGLVIYGGYLNYTDDKKIAERLADTRIDVKAKRISTMTLYPMMHLDAIKLYSENMADAIALVNGNLVACNVKKNDYVQKGDLLATLQNEQISLKIQQATSSLKRAEASLAQATNAYSRQGRLMARNATSKEKYEESEAQYNAANAAVAEAAAVRAQAIVDEEHLKIYAPISGDVLMIYAGAGKYITAGSPVALIGDFQRLRFSMTIDDSSASGLKFNDMARLKFSEKSFPKAYDTEYAPGNRGVYEDIRARLVDMTPPLSEPASIRRLIWEVDNQARILEPLTYNNVSIISELPYQCLAVPLDALVDGKRAVFVVDENGVVDKREVKTGAEDGEYAEIISGLKEGDVVIIENFEGIGNGVNVNVILE